MKPHDLTPTDAAEAVATGALSFLTREPERVGRFLAESGLGPDSVRDAAGRPEFLVAVLDHLLADEPLLLVFCEEQGLKPRHVWAARRALGGRPTEYG